MSGVSTPKAGRCGSCDKVIPAGNETIVCESCGRKFHPSCAKRVKLNEEGSVNKCCDPSRKSGFAAELKKQLGSLKEELKTELGQVISNNFVQVSNRLDGIDASLASLESARASDKEEVIVELREREKRACNVILFNLQPDGDKSVLDVTNDIFGKIPDFPKAKSCFRFTSGRGAIKPIKVIFNDKSEALFVLRNKVKLAPFGLTVKNDCTAAQLEYLKRVRREIDNRIGNGESDITIRFVNEVPRIVKKN